MNLAFLANLLNLLFLVNLKIVLNFDSGEIGVSAVFVETGQSGCLNNNI